MAGNLRWLRPEGAMLPDRVTIHLAAASEAALDLGFWDSVYGFSMRPVRCAGLIHASRFIAELVGRDGLQDTGGNTLASMVRLSRRLL